MTTASPQAPINHSISPITSEGEPNGARTEEEDKKGKEEERVDEQAGDEEIPVPLLGE